MDGHSLRLARNLVVLSCAMFAGCINPLAERSLVKNSIPANTVKHCLGEKSRDNLVPIDFTLLRQTLPAEHIIGPRDVLGIYIEGVVDDTEKLPAVNFLPPTDGLTPYQSPSIGHPVVVNLDGTITLPYIDPLNVNGMTVGQALVAMRASYAKAKVLDPSNTRISVSLIRARTYHIVVMREDSSNTGIINANVQILSQRGSGDAIELPAFKNDILHALTATGGLPGEDAANEIWVYRRSASGEWNIPWNMMHQFGESGISNEISMQDGCSCNATDYCNNALRIPLRVPCGMPPTFSPEDVVLQDGDVVYVKLRRDEYFVGAGLLQGGKYILPRDRDTDIFDAIAITNSSALGPSGSNAGSTIFRNGPGNIVAPSQVIVLRKLPNGTQVKIAVDLRVAVNDSRERILIQPGDVVLLRYRPSELLANTFLNVINIGYSIPNN